MSYNKDMKIIPREAGRVTYSTEIRNLKKLKFSDYQRAVIIGSVLGDGCLCENWSKTNYRLLITQNIGQKDYILWKFSILKDFILSEPRYYKRTNSLTIRTISHPELTELRSLFYQGRKKIIPSNIAEFIRDPVTVAVWFMDDGNAAKRLGSVVRAFNLNTQSFTLAENKLLLKAFNNIWQIHPSINMNHGYPRLYIGINDALKFVKIVKPYILPQMKYKIG